MNAYLMLADGRYLGCYMWSSKRAIWTDDVRKAWWGSLETAYKIQDQWGAGSSPLKAIEKSAHLAKLLEDATRELNICKQAQKRASANEIEYNAASERLRQAFGAYTHIVSTIDDVGDE